VKKVVQDAPEPIKSKARSGEISVNRAEELSKILHGKPDEFVELALRVGNDNPEKIDILLRLYKSRTVEGSNATFDEIAQTGGFQWGDEMDKWLDYRAANVQQIQNALRSVARYHIEVARLADEQAQVDAARSTPAPEGKYRCLVVDPPYPTKKIMRRVRPAQGINLDYPTMPLEAIAALPIPDLADEDGCHLYLWTTQKYLPAALELVKGWGFHYQCLHTWVKPTGMTPYSFMYNTELVIFATRGKLSLVQYGQKLSFEAPSPGHSIKPNIFYERVQLVSPEPRLEMFARKEREGFSVWGNEVLEAIHAP
jgi:N6-adenosine-specific RNA methylase IME4